MALLAMVRLLKKEIANNKKLEFKMITKNIKKLLFIVCLLTAVFAAANFALAATTANVWGEDVNGANFQATTGLGGADVRVTIANIIRLALGFLGIIAVILIMYAGWLWMTAGGSSDKIEKAKKILIGALIGLLLILSAFAIASFILNQLIGATGGGDVPGGPGIPVGPGGGTSYGSDVRATSPNDGAIMLPQNTEAMFFFDAGIEVKP